MQLQRKLRKKGNKTPVLRRNTLLYLKPTARQLRFIHFITGRQITTCTPVRQPTAFCNFFSVSHVKRTTLAKHENACSAVGKSETTFVQTVSLLLLTGKQYSTAFRAIISASHVERTTLVNMKTIVRSWKVRNVFCTNCVAAASHGQTVQYSVSCKHFSKPR